MNKITAAQVMTKELVTVAPGTPFKDVVRVLAEHQISAVPVVDDTGEMLGVVSELDLLGKQERLEEDRRWFRDRRQWEKAPARTAAEAMSAPVICVEPDFDIPEVARILARERIRRVFVVDKAKRPIGVIARRDLLGLYLRTDEEIAEQVRSQVLQYVLWALPTQVDVSVKDGVVTLTGQLETDGETEIALRLTKNLPGVVDVVDRLRPARIP